MGFFVLGLWGHLVLKSSSPTTEEVESLHAVYVKALKDLYKEYNPKYGEPGVELVVE